MVTSVEGGRAVDVSGDEGGLLFPHSVVPHAPDTTLHKGEMREQERRRWRRRRWRRKRWRRHRQRERGREMMEREREKSREQGGGKDYFKTT